MSNIIISKALFYDFDDFLEEIKNSKYMYKFKVLKDCIQIPDEKQLKNPMAILERRIIIDRHSKTTDEELASMLFRMVINKDDNFIPYLRRMTENYTIEDYFNKIIKLFRDIKNSNYYYVIGSLLEIIKYDNEKLYKKLAKKHGEYIGNLAISLNRDESYRVYMKRPNVKYKITMEDRVNYQLMTTCIKIANYYMKLKKYILVEEYVNKAIDFFPYSYKPYLSQKQLFIALNKDYDLNIIIRNKKLKNANADLYGFEDNTYDDFISIVKKI